MSQKPWNRHELWKWQDWLLNQCRKLWVRIETHEEACQTWVLIVFIDSKGSQVKRGWLVFLIRGSRGRGARLTRDLDLFHRQQWYWEIVRNYCLCPQNALNTTTFWRQQWWRDYAGPRCFRHWETLATWLIIFKNKVVPGRRWETGLLKGCLWWYRLRSNTHRANRVLRNLFSLWRRIGRQEQKMQLKNYCGYGANFQIIYQTSYDDWKALNE